MASALAELLLQHGAPRASRRFALRCRIAPVRTADSPRFGGGGPVKEPLHFPAKYSTPSSPSQRVLVEQPALLSEFALRRANGMASLQGNAKELSRAAYAANSGLLLDIAVCLRRLASSIEGGSASASAAVRVAWDAVAHRVVELSRVGNLSEIDDWALLLDAFAAGRYSNAALLFETELALVGAISDPRATAIGLSQTRNSLLNVAGADALATIVIAVDNMASLCGLRLLNAAADRLGELLCESASRHLTLKISVAGSFAGAYARARLRREEVISLVHATLSVPQAPLAKVDLVTLERDTALHSTDETKIESLVTMDAAISDLAFFCHAFGLVADGFIGSWLLPRVTALFATCDAVRLGRILPFLSSVISRDEVSRAAFADAVRRRLHNILIGTGASAKLPDDVAPQLLEALGLSRERDLSIISRLSAKCLRSAPRLDAGVAIASAVALARIGVRQERLLTELADNLVVRHQRTLSLDDMEYALRAWIRLRVPHAELAVAFRRRVAFLTKSDISADEDVKAANAALRVSSLIEDFDKVVAPGAGIAASPFGIGHSGIHHVHGAEKLG